MAGGGAAHKIHQSGRKTGQTPPEGRGGGVGAKSLTALGEWAQNTPMHLNQYESLFSLFAVPQVLT